MTKRVRFQKLINRKQPVLMPVAHDALSAKIIESVGFEALSIGGFGVAASRFGLPDTGIITQTEMVQAINDIVTITSLPVLADADTGYGGPQNVARTVSLYERVGVAALFIEDQVEPKRCGHTNVKAIIPAETMVAKLKAAVAARQDPNLLLIARTDARTTHNLNEAIERAKLYLQAGAEAIFIEGPRTVAELRRIPQELPKVKLLVNMLDGGKTPLLPAAELGRLGYTMIAYPVTTLLVTTKAVTQAMKHLKETGETSGLKDSMVSFPAFRELIGFSHWLDIIRSPKDEVDLTPRSSR